MRTIIYAGLLILLSGITVSQSIRGTVKDKENNTAIEGAAVSLLKGRDTTFVKGLETDKSGMFNFTDLTPGTYTVKVTYVGYSSSVIRGIAINRNNPDITLDTIKLSTKTTETEEIVVESQKSPIEFAPDKKVFNLEENNSFKGGNAIDVLRNMPSVTVDADNNVSLRGTQNVRILVDGKPFGLEGSNRNLILEQMPADQITAIEIITNPSAKYEAEGTSGIINIITKRSEGTSYNGSIMFNAGTKDKYRGSINLNYKKGNVNLIGSYDFNLMNFDFNGDNLRNYNSGTITSQREDDLSKMKMKFHMGKLGIEYGLDKLMSISLSGNYNKRNRSRNESELTETYDNNNSLSGKYNNITTEEHKGWETDISSNFTKRFKNPKQVLTADINYEYEKESENGNTSLNYIIPQTYSKLNRQFTDETNQNLRGQIDYVHPFSETRKIETGLKHVYRKQDIDYRYEDYDTITNTYIINKGVSNRYIYKENILAGYATYTDEIGKFGYQLGLRGEYTLSNGDLINTGENFKQKYFSIFPSASLSYKIAQGSQVQLSYSRRINRPRHRQTNPFVNISDPNNRFQGNPSLKPEYIDSYELSFLQYIGNISITPSVFLRETHDRIANYRTLIDSTTTLTTFVNYDNSRAYGTEFMINAQPFKWWNFNGSFSWFVTDVNASNLASGLSNKNSTWSTRFMTSIRLPDLVNIQANYMYTGKMYTAQGYMEPIQSLDVALNRDIIKDKLNIGLRISDVLNTQQYKIVWNDNNFNEVTTRKRDSRSVFLSLTYKFGEAQKQERNRRRPEQNEPQEPDIDEF